MTDKPTNSLISSAVFWQKEINRLVTRQIEWMNSPAYKLMAEEYRARWLAKPWYERAAIRAKARLDSMRERAGEIVAGRRFDEE